MEVIVRLVRTVMRAFYTDEEIAVVVRPCSGGGC